MFRPALHNPPDGTVLSELAKESPALPRDSLLFSIVNIETITPLFSLWHIDFVLLALLDHAPPLILAATTG